MNSKQNQKFKGCSFSDPFIYVNDGALSKEFCESVIQKFEKDDGKVQGKIANLRVDETVKKSTDLSISDNVEWKKEDSIFYESLKHEYINYTKKIKYSVEGALAGDRKKEAAQHEHQGLPHHCYRQHHPGRPC